MWKQRMSLERTLKFVLTKREVGPNNAFYRQLRMLENALKLPLDDSRGNKLHPIDEIELRLSLLPQILRYRVSRLETEKWGMFINK